MFRFKSYTKDLYTIKSYNLMGKIVVKKEGFKCERCEHEWIPNDIKQEPTVCPKCKSPYWNKPRKLKK